MAVTNRWGANDYVRTVLGVLLLIISALAFFNVFYYNDFSIVFWFCYLSLPLVGIGILTNSSALVKSQLYILAIPDFIWTVEFVSHLINGRSILGFVDYLFLAGDVLPKIVTLQHIIALPIIFYSLVLLKNKETGSWKISVAQLSVVYLLTLIFTSPDANVNCVYDICGYFSLNLGAWYVLLWFAVSFLMVYISRKIFIKSHELFRNFFNITT
jgi:hypothetical protein